MVFHTINNYIGESGTLIRINLAEYNWNMEIMNTKKIRLYNDTEIWELVFMELPVSTIG